MRDNSRDISPNQPVRDLVLASGSSARRALLANAGVHFRVVVAGIDERAVEAPLLAAGATPADVAQKLAEAKAVAVSRAENNALVIGADQTLDCDGARWTKPGGRNEARDQLTKLAGRAHQLHSALAVARAGEVIWSVCDSARLVMRSLTAADIDAYLAEVGDAALASVGAYQIEGPGIRLFERIEGNYFTILGLPLLPLLAFLRAEGAVA